MIGWALGNAFQRWGIPGLVCGLLALFGGAIWLVTAVTWLATGVFLLFGALAGLGYLLLLVAFVRWLRARRQPDHLLMHGRRRWPE